MNSPKLFAIGDVHGHFRELMGLYDRLLREADLQPERDTVVFLGDLVDRGPDTGLVMAWCMTMAGRYPHWVFLRGNHGDLMLDALRHRCRNYGSFDLWWLQGGRATADSYLPADADPFEPPCAQARAAIPAAHLDWLEARPLYHETGRYIFAHAGIRPGIPLAEQRREDLLWIREDFLLSGDAFGGKRVIFGHTPFREPLVEPNKVGIDTMFHSRGMLTAVELSGREPAFYHQDAVAGRWPAHICDRSIERG